MTVAKVMSVENIDEFNARGFMHKMKNFTVLEKKEHGLQFIVCEVSTAML